MRNQYRIRRAVHGPFPRTGGSFTARGPRPPNPHLFLQSPSTPGNWGAAARRRRRAKSGAPGRPPPSVPSPMLAPGPLVRRAAERLPECGSIPHVLHPARASCRSAEAFRMSGSCPSAMRKASALRQARDHLDAVHSPRVSAPRARPTCGLLPHSGKLPTALLTRLPRSCIPPSGDEQHLPWGELSRN